MPNQVKQLKLNSDQQAAADGFFQFLMGPDKELRISGPGGVGKTFLMGYLIDQVMPMYEETCQMLGMKVEYYDVQMTATTNKAAEVLGIQTGRPTSTVHSFFGLKVKEDYDTGDMKVEKSTAWTVHQNMILFIDEASMIDAALYEYIQEGTHKCKVVYVGDKNQLAPVKEVLSPVYRRPMQMFELLEPMRTSIPELQALNQQMRDVVQSGRLVKNDKGQEVMVFDFTPIKIVPGLIDWISGPDFEQEIAQTFAQQTDKAVILAYSNNRVVEYNTHIRGVRGLPSHFTPGEELISNTAVRFGKHALRVEDEITILDVSPVTEFVSMEGGVELEVRSATIRTHFGDEINVQMPEDRQHYTALIKYYQKQKNWRMYFQLKNNYPDLRQRDARTVYKIQGSTVDTVYIDVGNLSTCHNPAQVARMLYVAVSRARKRVVFYGDLAEKYGGLTF